jgi:hypothetical protein
MAGPWDQYQQPEQATAKPWEQYSAPEPKKADTSTTKEESRLPKLNNLFGVGEAALNLGSGLVAKTAGDVAGLGTIAGSALGLTNRDPRQVQQDVTKGLTYQPRSTLGKNVAEYNPLALAGKGIGAVANAAGNAVGGGADADTLRGAAGNLTREVLQQAPGFVAPAFKGKIAARTAQAEADLAAQKAANAPRDAAVMAAREKGYALPPSVSGNTGPLASFFQGVAGSTKLDYGASFKNQKVTNNLIKKELGLPGDKALSVEALEDLREKYSKPYEDVKKTVPTLRTTPEFKQALQNPDSKFAAARKEFPEYFKSAEIDKLVSDLSKDKFSSKAAIEIQKKLRYDGNANMKAFDKPTQQALGEAQLNAAKAIDDLIDQNLNMQAPPGVKNFQSKLSTNLAEARKKIAQSYAVQGALNNATGNISAQKLGRLWEKQGTLTGGLKDVGQTYNQFQKQLRDVDKLPATASEGVSNLDVAKSTGLAALGHGALAAAAIPLRAAVKPVLLSDWYQQLNVKPPSYQLGLGTRLPQALANNPALGFGIPRPPQDNQQ